jgi:hypothetical protein
MSAGNAEAWDDLFSDNLVPSVLALVLEAWSQIDKPDADAREDDTSVRLYRAMVRAKTRSRHPFLIRLQDVEVSSGPAGISGRKDIVFFPVLEESIYLCLEAKRLNALVGGVRKALAAEYVKNGMQRFVDRKYSRDVRHGGMLGYVMDGDIARAMKNVANNIAANHEALLMNPPGKLEASLARPSDPHVRVTCHRRSHEQSIFRIHHLFVG